jgi:hypothetical protein
MIGVESIKGNMMDYNKNIFEKYRDVTLPSTKIVLPKYRAELIINDSFHISTFKKLPNFFWCFMQYIFFGFKWRKIENSND